MKKRKGFTLIELMIVILIVGILAAVLVPMLQGSVEAARWSEGKAGAGTIATALRAYIAENSAVPGTTIAAGAFEAIGLTDGDLHGKYFTSAQYSVASISYVAANDPSVIYTITIAAPTGLSGSHTLNHLGIWDAPTE